MGGLRDWWAERGWAARLFFGWLALFILFVAGVKLGQAVGLLEQTSGPVVTGEQPPAWSRTECLRRHTWYYYERNPDLAELPDDISEKIVRACTDEGMKYAYGRE